MSDLPPPPPPTPAEIEAYYANRPELRVPASEPGLIPKAANLGRALVTHAVAGFPEADEATAQARLAICRACDRFDATRTVCTVCGCFLDIKIRWNEQKCPLNSW
jgi:hypothetical protein